MKYLILIVLMGFLTSNLNAQELSWPCNFLDLILDSKRTFVSEENLQVASKRYFNEDSNGKTTEILEGKQWNTKTVRFTLIDTFNFFDAECGRVFKNETIRVTNDFSLLKLINDNVFLVTGIATGKDNFIAVAIANVKTNLQITYHFSVFGKDIKIEKATSGFR